jgi:hypothetical protein
MLASLASQIPILSYGYASTQNRGFLISLRSVKNPAIPSQFFLTGVKMYIVPSKKQLF